MRMLARTRTARNFSSLKLPQPRLNGGYTIFGQCDDAAVVLVKQIARMATDPATDHMPLRPVKIIHISIVRSTAAAAKPGAGTAVKKPAAAKPRGEVRISVALCSFRADRLPRISSFGLLLKSGAINQGE